MAIPKPKPITYAGGAAAPSSAVPPNADERRQTVQPMLDGAAMSDDERVSNAPLGLPNPSSNPQGTDERHDDAASASPKPRRPEEQLDVLTAQRERIEAELKRTLIAEEEVRRQVAAAQARREELADLYLKQNELIAAVNANIKEQHDIRDDLTDIERELDRLSHNIPPSDDELTSSRLLQTIHMAEVGWLEQQHSAPEPLPYLPSIPAAATYEQAIPPAPPTEVAHASPFDSYTAPAYPDPLRLTGKYAAPTISRRSLSHWGIRGSLFGAAVNIATAALIAITLIVVLLYIGVFSDHNNSGSSLKPTNRTGLTASANPTATQAALQEVVTTTPSIAAATPTDIPATATSAPILIPATPTISVTLAASAATPTITPASDEYISTGTHVEATATPPPHHDDSTQPVAISIPDLQIDSAVVAVQPQPGRDGQMYWGVDDTRIGLETHAIGCGEPGNIVVNGHNWVTHGVFAPIGKLHHDDRLPSLNDALVTCKAAGGATYTYRVFAYGVFEANDASFTQLLTGEQRNLALYTCTNSGRQRIVIVARLQV